MASMVGVMNAAIDRMAREFGEVRRWAIDATTKTVDDAVRGVDIVAVRVAQEISPVWCRMTPEARVSLLGLGVTVSPSFCRTVITVNALVVALKRLLPHGVLHQILFACVVRMVYVAAMRLQEPRPGSKKTTTPRSVSVSIHPTSEKCGPMSLHGSFPPSPVELGGKGSFDSQESVKVELREQDEELVSTSGMRSKNFSEAPTTNDESEEAEIADEVAHLLTSKNHSSDSPLEKAGADDLVAPKPKKALAPVTPQQSRSGRRRSSTASSAKSSTLGSTMTPAGVRQSVRIRSTRKLS